MLLVNGEITINDRPAETFRMIPIDQNCPYNEAVYNTESQVLFIISKEKKNNLQPIPKKDDIIIEKYYEYHITTPNEIVSFVKRFAENHEAFDYPRYMRN